MNRLVILACCVLCGCTTPRSVFVNDKGEYITCAASGVGIVAGIVAQSRFDSCVADARTRGYRPEESK